MTPEQLIPKMEGMLGYMLGSADGGSVQGNTSVTEWVRLVKELLKGPDFRYLTDLEFQPLADVDDTGVETASTATHLIACLGEMVSTIATDTSGWFGAADVSGDTIELGAAALGDDVIFVNHFQDVATTGVSEFYPMLFLAGSSDGGTYGTTGVSLSTALTFWSDGDGGNDTALNGFRIWVVYRS